MDRAQAELNALKRTEEDLKKGHQKLEEMVTRLDQEVVSNSLHNGTVLTVATAKFSVCTMATLSTVGMRVEMIVHTL